jgi:hypothetical protein
MGAKSPISEKKDSEKTTASDTRRSLSGSAKTGKIL